MNHAEKTSGGEDGLDRNVAEISLEITFHPLRAFKLFIGAITIVVVAVWCNVLVSRDGDLRGMFLC